ncbi:hypothetical protein AXG93_723s1090 [Marchantia polymorpha subsp. ruderalis]|uniref:CN hydrolase domain-containing protein n=1 Tax=Marchantia polymorpha subsp. ruderalis TaxID=1480154 RepID=A0A176VCG2_MARPO|nr:hypothetical protein AXG93_723s1090 [Marchantia polymorpha subsp. ruderalis]
MAMHLEVEAIVELKTCRSAVGTFESLVDLEGKQVTACLRLQCCVRGLIASPAAAVLMMETGRRLTVANSANQSVRVQQRDQMLLQALVLRRTGGDFLSQEWSTGWCSRMNWDESSIRLEAYNVDCFIGEAASLGAQLAVCPEAFIVGYPRGATSVIGSRSVKGREDYRKYLASAVNEPGPEADRLGAISGRFKVHLFMSVIEPSGGILYCSLLYFDSQEDTWENTERSCELLRNG